jgi:ribosomal protein S27E
MKNVTCPYCQSEQYINHDDGYGYSEDTKHNQECEKCGKTFIYETTIIFYYDSFKAPCLNDDSNHDYHITKTFPKEFSNMECSICGDIRELTNEERMQFNIGTREDYLRSLKS